MSGSNDAVISVIFDATGAKRGADEIQAAAAKVIGADRDMSLSAAQRAVAVTRNEQLIANERAKAATAAQQKATADNALTTRQAAVEAQLTKTIADENAKRAQLNLRGAQETARVANLGADGFENATKRIVTASSSVQKMLDGIARGWDPFIAGADRARKTLENLLQVSQQVDKSGARTTESFQAEKMLPEARSRLDTAERNQNAGFDVAKETERLTAAFAPAIDAAAAMKAEIADLNRALSLGIDVEGGQVAQLARIAAKYNETAKAVLAFNDAMRAASSAGPGFVRGQGAASMNVDQTRALISEFDKGYAVTLQFNAAMGRLNELEDAGIQIAGGYGAARAALRVGYEKDMDAVRSLLDAYGKQQVMEKVLADRASGSSARSTGFSAVEHTVALNDDQRKAARTDDVTAALNAGDVSRARFDSIFANSQKYAKDWEDLNAVIKQLGLTEAQAAVLHDNLRASMDRGVGSVEKEAAAMDRLRSKWDPMHRLQTQYKNDLAEIEKLNLEPEAATKAKADALAYLNRGVKDIESGGRNAAFAIRQVGVQFTQGFSGLMTGQDFFTVLIQQGHQLLDVSLATGTGFSVLKDAAKGAWAAITSPIGLVITGVTAVIGAFTAFAVVSETSARRLGDLRNQLSGVRADYAQAAVAADDAARHLANTSALSSSQARGFINPIVRSGNFTDASKAQLEDMARTFEKLNIVEGKSIDNADRLKQAIKSPAEMLKSLYEDNPNLEGLSSDLVRLALELEQSGEKGKSHNLMLAALAIATRNAKENLTPFQQALHDLGESLFGVKEGGRGLADTLGGPIIDGLTNVVNSINAVVKGVQALVGIVPDWMIKLASAQSFVVTGGAVGTVPGLGASKVDQNGKVTGKGDTLADVAANAWQSEFVKAGETWRRMSLDWLAGLKDGGVKWVAGMKGDSDIFWAKWSSDAAKAGADERANGMLRWDAFARGAELAWAAVVQSFKDAIVSVLTLFPKAAGAPAALGKANTDLGGTVTEAGFIPNVPATAADMVTIKSPISGSTFTVNKDTAPAFQGLINDLENRGYLINPRDISSYRPGATVAGTGAPSKHGSGDAIDVNASRNGVGTTGDIPPALARELAKTYGMRWGGDFRNPDPMHFGFDGMPKPGAGFAPVSTAAPIPAPPPPIVRTTTYNESIAEAAKYTDQIGLLNETLGKYGRERQMLTQARDRAITAEDFKNADRFNLALKDNADQMERARSPQQEYYRGLRDQVELTKARTKGERDLIEQRQNLDRLDREHSVTADPAQRAASDKAYMDGRHAAVAQQVVDTEKQIKQQQDLAAANLKGGTAALEAAAAFKARQQAEDAFGPGPEREAAFLRYKEIYTAEAKMAMDASVQTEIYAGKKAAALQQEVTEGDRAAAATRQRISELKNLPMAAADAAAIMANFTAEQAGKLKQLEYTIARDVVANKELAAATLISGSAALEAAAKTKAFDEASRLFAAGTPQHAAAMAELTKRYKEQMVAQAELQVAQQIQGNKNQIEYLEKETALLGENALVREKALAVLKVEQDLKMKGVPLDSPMAQERRQSESSLVQTQSDNQFAKNNMAELTNIYETSFNTIGSSIVDAFDNGKSALQNFTDLSKTLTKQILNEFMKLAIINPLLNSIFGGNRPTAFGVGEAVSKIGGAANDNVANAASSIGNTTMEAAAASGATVATGGFTVEFHRGGVVGIGGVPRSVHPAYFDDAPRFHTGMKPSLAHDEFPAILQRGERVLTEKQDDRVLDVVGKLTAAAMGKNPALVDTHNLNQRAHDQFFDLLNKGEEVASARKYHGGGIVGVGGVPWFAAPDLFRGAPRFHEGGAYSDELAAAQSAQQEDIKRKADEQKQFQGEQAIGSTANSALMMAGMIAKLIGKGGLAGIGKFFSGLGDKASAFWNWITGGTSAASSAAAAAIEAGGLSAAVPSALTEATSFAAMGSYASEAAAIAASIGPTSAMAGASTAEIAATMSSASLLPTAAAAVVHEGWRVGLEAPPAVRGVGPGFFENLPRMHTGSPMGYDEFGAILQKGERVLTAPQQRAMVAAANDGGEGGGTTNHFNFNLPGIKDRQTSETFLKSAPHVMRQALDEQIRSKNRNG